MQSIGIDLGGTKIAGVLMRGDGQVLREALITTPKSGYASILNALCEMIEELDGGVTTPVGVGSPGAVSPTTGKLRNCNTVCLNGTHLHLDLERKSGRSVRIANDANCFALSEAIDGAGEGSEAVFGVILGTGVGGGLVVRNRLRIGRNAIAGEWGHNPLPWPDAVEISGHPCYCGKSGCIETWLAGPSLQRDAGGIYQSVQQVVAAAAEGDAACIEALERYMRRLAKSLASVINLFDPDVVVLGGGVSNLSAIYQEVPALWGEYVFSDAVHTRLLPARYGAASGVRGAAWLWGNPAWQT